MDEVRARAQCSGRADPLGRDGDLAGLVRVHGRRRAIRGARGAGGARRAQLRSRESPANEEKLMQFTFLLDNVAVLVRHWYEVGPSDEEHGTRVEVRTIARPAHVGTESAAQPMTLDRPLW